MTATSATATTLLDEALPTFDFGNRHERHVNAPSPAVWDAIEGFRMGRAADLLFKARGIHLPSGRIRDVLARSRFAILAEEPGREVVAGTFGRFWALRELENMQAPRDLEEFRTFRRPGWAQGAVSLRTEALADGSTMLSTETRVRCVDDASRRRFARYWILIRVFSGWLRTDLLRRIARDAEGRR